jgi:23S rRNA (cytosine1962-C5)-methyltransferase
MRADRLTIKLLPGQGKRLKAGAPWVFSNEIAMKAGYRRMRDGEIVQIEGDDGTPHGTFFFDPHALIAARLLDRDPAASIDDAWLFRRLEAAAALRERVCDSLFHRLVNAEGDGLPGLIVDRYGDVVVPHATIPGMERRMPMVVSALEALLPVREGWPSVVEEGGVRFPVGTGWYFDRRSFRDGIAALASGARVLDVCCHTGAFGLRCAAAGAEAVTLVDSSAAALALARDATLANGFADSVTIRQGDAFDVLGEIGGTQQRFDIVICDPPMLARSRREADVGLRAYGRLARLAAAVIAPGGFLFTASCSPHVSVESWAGHVAYGLYRARREGQVLWRGGAGMDHPVHPQLPEMAGVRGMLMGIA